MYSDGPEQDLKRLILIYIYIYGFSARPIHRHCLLCSIKSPLIVYQESPATKMCQYKYTQHSCGHIIQKLEENYDASCKLCVPVLVALKYYHDQPTHECLENARPQPPLRIPKPCRPAGPETPHTQPSIYPPIVESDAQSYTLRSSKNDIELVCSGRSKDN